jgi:hypothetical protein
MSVNRVFLNWMHPTLSAAADWLIERFPTAGATLRAACSQSSACSGRPLSRADRSFFLRRDSPSASRFQGDVCARNVKGD